MYQSQRFNLWLVKWSVQYRRQKNGKITKYLAQHDTVYESNTSRTCAYKSQQKINDHLYHAPESGGGDEHAVFHRLSVEQFCVFLVNPIGYLPTNRLSFSLKHTPELLADSNFTRPHREETALSSSVRVSESLFSSFSTLSLRMPTVM